MDDLIFSTLRLSVPLIFAALGGMLSERSGIANIALECYLLVAAFTAAAVTALSGSLLLGVVSGVFMSGVTAALFAGACIWGRGDQIVIGTAFNLLAVGLIPLFSKALFDVTGSTPALPAELRFHEPWWFMIWAAILALFYSWKMRNTKAGLRIHAAGENPRALITQGVSFHRVRFWAVVEGGLVAGFGGVYLSLCQGSGYIREMSAGRGFIALAALIFGAWKPLPTLAACLFFAFTDAIQIQLQGQKWGEVTIPNQFIQIIPFVVTLILLLGMSRTIRAPNAINNSLHEP